MQYKLREESGTSGKKPRIAQNAASEKKPVVFNPDRLPAASLT